MPEIAQKSVSDGLLAGTLLFAIGYPAVARALVDTSRYAPSEYDPSARPGPLPDAVRRM